MNNSSLRPGGHRRDGRENCRAMLESCRRRQVSVIIGSDAHFWTEVGVHDDALALLREGGFPEGLGGDFGAGRLAGVLWGGK